MDATDAAMKAQKVKILHKNRNGYKVVEYGGWIKVLYAGGGIKAKFPVCDLKYIGGPNLWIEQNTR